MPQIEIVSSSVTFGTGQKVGTAYIPYNYEGEYFVIAYPNIDSVVITRVASSRGIIAVTAMNKADNSWVDGKTISISYVIIKK